MVVGTKEWLQRRHWRHFSSRSKCNLDKSWCRLAPFINKPSVLLFWLRSSPFRIHCSDAVLFLFTCFPLTFPITSVSSVCVLLMCVCVCVVAAVMYGLCVQIMSCSCPVCSPRIRSFLFIFVHAKLANIQNSSTQRPFLLSFCLNWLFLQFKVCGVKFLAEGTRRSSIMLSKKLGTSCREHVNPVWLWVPFVDQLSGVHINKLTDLTCLSPNLFHPHCTARLAVRWLLHIGLAWTESQNRSHWMFSKHHCLSHFALLSLNCHFHSRSQLHFMPPSTLTHSISFPFLQHLSSVQSRQFLTIIKNNQILLSSPKLEIRDVFSFRFKLLLVCKRFYSLLV